MPRPITPFIVPIVISTAAAVFLTVYTWRRRTTPGAKALAGLTLGTSLWLIGYAFELLGSDAATKLFWAKFQYFGIVTVPLMWLVFALEFAKKGHWLTPRNWTLAITIPLATLSLAWTNDRHGLIWQEVQFNPALAFPALSLTYGAGFWVYWTFTHLVLAAGSLLIGGVLIHSLHLYRWQAGCLLIGVLTPWLANGVYILRLGPFPNLDLTPFAFVVSGTAFTLSLLQFRLLDILPVAQKEIMESMSDGVLVLDPNDRIVDLNPAAAALIGQAQSAVIGKLLSEGFAPWSVFISQNDRSRKAQTDISLKVGSALRNFDLRSTPLLDRRQQLSARLIVLRDITDLKRAEEVLARDRDQALAASQLKTELLARVSHELRTPLSVILGFTEMLQIGAFGPVTEEQKQVSEEVIGATRELTSLVDQLLDQAQLESGRIKLRSSSVNLSELIEEVLSRFQMVAQVKCLTLSAAIATDFPVAFAGDRTRLQQILVNLVGNALKFTVNGGVRVSAYRSGSKRWSLQVSDTGEGIPQAAQSFIFEPFRQVDGSTTRRHGGIGLGLSIVKQFATLMDADVTLESTLGKGSTFIVNFPLILELTT